MKIGVDYQLNSTQKWDFENPLPHDIPIWVLAEEDTCDPTQIPSIFRVIYNRDAEAGMKTRLLDFDPDLHEEILSGNRWSIVAWRPMTNHGGTWDRYYEKHNVDERSNWNMTLDRQSDDSD